MRPCTPAGARRAGTAERLWRTELVDAAGLCAESRICGRATGHPQRGLFAERAGVAVQTVFFVFHTKAELLSRVVDAAVLGPREAKPPEETDW